MFNYLAIFLGGGLGACLRHYATLMAHRFFGMRYPYGTFLINVTGSVFLGFVATLALQRSGSFNPQVRLFLATGVAGGFTTFSTFSWEILTLFREGQILAGVLYSAVSVIIGLIGVYLGYLMAKCI